MTETEIKYDNGVPIVPNVHPILVLAGDDFQMGSQYVHQLYDIYGDFAMSFVRYTYTPEQEAAVLEYQAYLKKYTPEFEEMLQGMVAGAQELGYDFEYRDFLTSFCTTMSLAGPARLPTYPGSEKLSVEQDALHRECSGFAAWGSATTDGKLVCGGSGDHIIEFLNVVMCYPTNGNNMIFRLPMENVSLGMFPAMNNKGVAYAHHGSGIFGNEQPGYGVFGVAQVFHSLRFANTAEEALEMQASYPMGTRGDGIWCDVHGNAGILECRDPKTIRRAGDHGEKDFIYATNTVLTEALEPLLSNYLGWPLSYVEHGGWLKDDLNSERRNLCMWNALHNYHGHINTDFAKMLFRMGGPAPAYSTIRLAEKKLYETEGEGWWPYCGNLANITVAFAEPDDGDEGMYYVCAGHAGRQIEPLGDEWYFYNVAQLYTFYDLKLAGSVVDVVTTAKAQCDRDMFVANRELSKLGAQDVAYWPLSKIFADATIAYQKGNFYLGTSHFAKKDTYEVPDDETLARMAKALRFYTQCQAFSRHVYESLKPPATCPSDLGLNEWMGEWGDWTTGPISAKNLAPVPIDEVK